MPGLRTKLKTALYGLGTTDFWVGAFPLAPECVRREAQVFTAGLLNGTVGSGGTVMHFRPGQIPSWHPSPQGGAWLNTLRPHLALFPGGEWVS